jgi:DNA-binding beta-propeller fold protein YncE
MHTTCSRRRNDIMRTMIIGALMLLLGAGNAPGVQAAGVTFVAAIQDDATLGSASAVAVSPDGAHVYAAAPGSRSHTLVAFARDSLTGLLTPVDVERNGVGGVEGLDSPEAMAVSPDGAHVYVAGTGDNAVAVFARDPGTGALEFVEAVQILDRRASP